MLNYRRLQSFYSTLPRTRIKEQQPRPPLLPTPYQRKQEPELNAFPRDIFNGQMNSQTRKIKPSENPNSNIKTPKSTLSTQEAVNVKRSLAREFIHDSLYNPTYGYFSKRAIIFSFAQDLDFREMKDLTEFMHTIQGLYSEYDDLESEEALQVWHTPTELFKPWYGYALAEYILQEYKASGWYSAGIPLKIYEMGAGNGTMMRNVMDYIKMKQEDVYMDTTYNIIEISGQLTERQEWNNMSRLSDEMKNYPHQVKIINKSVFDWDTKVEDPCFFIALEVIDNFAHDVVRYNLSSDFGFLDPMQGYVITKEDGNMEEIYEPLTDPLISRYLSLRNQTNYLNPLLQVNKRLISWRRKFPFAPNMTDCEFLPTMQLQFMETLRDKFPRHKLILSDFDSLPTEVPGLNAPIVQTRQKNTMIPCSTYMVTPGWFDIFFPTDFEVMSDIYDIVNDGKSKIYSHADFLSKYGNLEMSRTKSGDVPMLQQYKNVKFLLSSDSTLT